MKRRDFLRGTAATALGLSLTPFELWAREAEDEVRLAFAKALAEKPWLLGYATASDLSFQSEAKILSGALPSGLRGSLFRNGPAQHEVGGRRYHHSFDGDGMVQRFQLTETGIQHSARFVQTQKLQREQEAGRPLLSGFGTHWPDLPPSRSPAEGNVANISVLWHANRLLALWEAADAHEIDPESLETRGIHAWSDETRGVPFSAHPRVDTDGTLWNFGSAPWAKMLFLYQISPQGKLIKVQPLPMEKPAYLHDFVITEKSLVFMLPPLTYELETDAPTFLENHAWHGDQPTRYLVVPKADLTAAKWLEGPAGFAFHFANAWEDSAGNIEIDACLYESPELMFTEQRDIMRGAWAGTSTMAEATTLRLGANGQVTHNPRGRNGEFPSIDPRRMGRRHRHSVSLSRVDSAEVGHPLLNAVTWDDLEGESTQQFTYAPNLIPEEHLYIPGTGTDPGWIVGTALDFVAKKTRLSVFRAGALADGPVVEAELPYALPLGLHGRFVDRKGVGPVG